MFTKLRGLLMTLVTNTETVPEEEAVEASVDVSEERAALHAKKKEIQLEEQLKLQVQNKELSVAECCSRWETQIKNIDKDVAHLMSLLQEKQKLKNSLMKKISDHRHA